MSIKFFFWMCVFLSLITFASAVDLPLDNTYVKYRWLDYNIVENTGELENYTTDTINYFYDDGWNITINMTGNEPQITLPIYAKKGINKSKIGNANRQANPLITNINFKIHGSELVHIGNQSLVINFTENTVLANNTVNDVFVYNLTKDTTDYTTWYNDSSKSWWQAANNTIKDSGMILDGAGDYSKITNDIDLATNNFTIEFWIKPFSVLGSAVDKYISYGGTGGWGTGTTHLKWQLFQFSNNHLYFQCCNNQLAGVNTPNPLVANKWNHIVITRRGSNFEVYHNKNSIMSGSTATQVYNGGDLVIGASPTGSEPIDGIYDEVMIRKGYALSPSEINQSYDRGISHLSNNITTNLTGHWTFNNDATDSSGNGNDGTFFGNAKITGKSSTTNFPIKSYLICSEAGLDIIDSSDNTMWQRNTSMNNCNQVFSKEGELFIDNAATLNNYSFIQDSYAGTKTRADKIFIEKDSYYWNNGSGICRDNNLIDFSYTCDDYVEQIIIQDIAAGGLIASSNGTNVIIYNDDLSINHSLTKGNITALAIADNNRTLYMANYSNNIIEYDFIVQQELRNFTSFLSNKFTSIFWGSLLIGSEDGGAFLLDIVAQEGIAAALQGITNLTIETGMEWIRLTWDKITDSSFKMYYNEIFGEIWEYNANSTQRTFPIPSADVYYNLTNLDLGETNGFNYTNTTQALGGSYLTATKKGLYKANLQISFGSGGAGLYGIAVVHNFDIDTHRDCYVRRSISNKNDYGSASITCLMDLDIGDKVNVQVEDEVSPTKDLFIQTANLNLLKIE